MSSFRAFSHALASLFVATGLWACGSSESEPKTQGAAGAGGSLSLGGVSSGGGRPAGGSSGAGSGGASVGGTNGAGTAGASGAAGNAGTSAMDCPAFAATACARLAACASYYLALDWGSEEECRSRIADKCQYFAGVGRPIDGDTCLAAIPEGQCDAIGLARGLPGLCVRPRGPTADRGPCRLDGECQSLKCFPSVEECGSCGEQTETGESCSLNGICPLGQVCSDFECQPLLQVGDACDDRSKERCPLGTTCTDDHCTAAGGLNAPCTSTGPYCNVAQGYRCDGSVCVAFAPANVGEHCANGEGIYCKGGNHCSPSGMCATAAKVGDPCGTGCQKDLFCVDGKCAYEGASLCGAAP